MKEACRGMHSTTTTTTTTTTMKKFISLLKHSLHGRVVGMYGDDGHCGVKVIGHDIVKLFDILLLLHQRCIIRLLQTHHHEPAIY
jgi:hypothetical protein